MTTKTAALPPLTADELAALPPRIDARYIIDGGDPWEPKTEKARPRSSN